MTLLRWIDNLSRLGRLTETSERVEAATIAAMRVRHRHPYLECSPLQFGEATVPDKKEPMKVASTFWVVLSSITNLVARGETLFVAAESAETTVLSEKL